MTPNINKLLEKDPAATRFTSHMGRVNLDLRGSKEKLHLQRVKLDVDKCDAGGYSWAQIANTEKLYCAFNLTGTVQLFMTAPDRKQSRRKLYLVYGVRFFN